MELIAASGFVIFGGKGRGGTVATGFTSKLRSADPEALLGEALITLGALVCCARAIGTLAGKFCCCCCCDVAIAFG